MKVGARHWFHISSKYHGETFTAIRRRPILIGSEEPKTPRICVCDLPAACFPAILPAPDAPVFVYRTTKPRRGIPAQEVWDSPITREHWLVPPVEFSHWKTVDADTANKITEPIRTFHMFTCRSSSVHLRVAQYLIALNVLPAEFSTPAERSAVRKFPMDLGIDHPERWILREAAKIMREDEEVAEG